MSAINIAVKEAIEPILAQAELFLEDLHISTAGKHRVIRVLIDPINPGTPLSLDDVTAVTKPISARLDSLVELGERPFTLEVSSPGIDFPLTLPRHWAKNKTRLVTITRTSGEKLSGRIIASDEHGATLELNKGVIENVPFASVDQAHIEIEFK